jgi:hypothetical protein
MKLTSAGNVDIINITERNMIDPKKIPLLLRPFIWIWNFIAYIVSLTGRLVAVILGLALMIVGALLTITVVGAIVGIPLIIIGILIIVRGLW